jgi:hypothetical protein
VQQVDDDISNPRQIFLQALGAGLLAQTGLENTPKQVWDVAEVGCVDVDGRKGPASHVEFIA